MRAEVKEIVMGFELTDEEACDLVNRTKKLLDILADAWDPSTGKTTKVLNKHLEEADKLSKRLNKIHWTKKI